MTISLLQVLRRVAAARQRLERGAQLRALTPQLVADVPQRRARLVGDLAARLDRAANRLDLRREGRGARGDAPQPARGGGDAAPDCRRDQIDRLDERRQAEQGQRRERFLADLEPAKDRLEVLGCRYGERSVVPHERHGFGRERQPPADLGCVRRRLERQGARPPQRRLGLTGQRFANAIELERA